MNKIFIVVAIIAFALLGCNPPEKAEDVKTATDKTEEKEKPKTEEKETAGLSTPTETMKTFLEALKKKDVKGVRLSISKSSLEQYEKIAEEQNKTLEEIMMSSEDNSMKENLEMRNEKIDGDSATLEVKDDDTGKWETIPFVKEEGSWKIAFDKMD